MSSAASSDCCCLLGLLGRRRGSRRASPSEDSLILPYPRRAPPSRPGQRPRCCLVKQQPEGRAAAGEWISSQEAIELKCYSLSKDRVVVSLDKRCCLLTPPNGLTRTRPLSCMEDGRRHLDTRRRPDSLSLIKLCVDPESGRLQRSLSIHEIDSDNEFEECKQQVANSAATAANQRLDHAALARQLSRRSLVIVERNVQTSKRHQHSSQVLEIPEGEGDSDGREPARTQEADSLEHDLVESLSLGPGSEFLCQNHTEQERDQDECDCSYEHVHAHDCSEQQQQQVVNEKKLDAFKSTPSKTRRRKPLKFVAKRLARWMGPSRRGGSETASERGDTPTPEIVAAPDQTDGRSCEQTSIGHQAAEQENQGQLVALGRPESIFLWPQRLSDAYATTLTGGSLATSSAAARQPRRPPASVMISYNHMEAKEYAIALHAALAAHGVSAYLDLYDIQKGEDWQDSLNFAILDCRLFVPLITPSYGETLWTSRECKLADVLAKRIVPINFRQRWPPPSLAIQFATLQYIDWLHHELASVLDPHMMDEGGAGWPRECVQAIARQLKARLESDMLDVAAAAAATTSERHEDSGVSTSGGGASAGVLQPAPLVEIEGGVATRSDSKQQHANGRANLNLRSLHAAGLPSSDTASTTPSSCHTTGSSSPSCYDSMAESSRSAATAYSPPGGSPTLLEELADSSKFVLVPTVSARVPAAVGLRRDPAAGTEPPPPPVEQRRKRSLGQRTKKVLTRLKSSLAVRSSAGA